MRVLSSYFLLSDMLNVAVDFVEEIDGWDEGCPRNFKKMFLQRVRFVMDIEWKCFNYSIVGYIYIGQNDASE